MPRVFGSIRLLFCFLVFVLTTTSSYAQNSTPPLGHVVVVALENHSSSDVVGSPSMPYFNSLISQYGLAQNFHANVHGSFPDYAMLTTGELITLQGFGLPDDFPISIDNIERELILAGKTWKVYAEGLPSVGYTGNDVYPYVKRHNPFAYMSDNLGGSSQANNIVPFSQFTTDVANNTLPNFSFVIPNAINDSEDCPGGGSCPDSTKLATADQWLQANLAPLLSNPAFQQDGLLVIWWDEGNAADTSLGGGQVAVTLVGPTIKPGFQSTTFYRHENLLRTLAEGLGLGFPGASLYVTSMAEFFGPKVLPGTITGHVTDSSTGAALAGANVSYNGGSTVTDNTGSYTLSNVPAGSVSVTASQTGYTSKTSTVTVTAGATATLNFQLTATPPTTGNITGHVTDSSSGAAIAGATVSFSGGSTVTDAVGSYTLSNVPAGARSVTASQTGYTSLTNTVTVIAGSTAMLDFQLTLIPVTTPGTISGRVTNITTGGAVSGATVSFSGGSTTTDSSGAYSFTNMTPGTYSVTATHTGYFAVTASATVASASTTTLNFAMATGGKVAGTVTNASGAVIAGAAVSIRGGSISTTVNTTTNSSGVYNSNWVPIGQYTVTVTASGHPVQSKSAAINTGATTTLNFTLQ
jgi:acid phosphatase